MIKPTHDLDGKLLVPQPKCKHCGKTKGYHKAYTYECPKGMKHRVIGYTMYGPEVYEGGK